MPSLVGSEMCIRDSISCPTTRIATISNVLMFHSSRSVLSNTPEPNNLYYQPQQPNASSSSPSVSTTPVPSSYPYQQQPQLQKQILQQQQQPISSGQGGSLLSLRQPQQQQQQQSQQGSSSPSVQAVIKPPLLPPKGGRNSGAATAGGTYLALPLYENVEGSTGKKVSLHYHLLNDTCPTIYFAPYSSCLLYTSPSPRD